MTFKHYLWERFKGFFTKERFKGIIGDFIMILFIVLLASICVFLPVIAISAIALYFEFAHNTEIAFNIGVITYFGTVSLFLLCDSIYGKIKNIKIDYDNKKIRGEFDNE